MRYIRNLILLLLFITTLYGDLEKTIHILVENQTDYKIAKDIKRIAGSQIGIEVYYDNYANIVQKVLTDPKAQFGIVNHDILLHEKRVMKEGFEDYVKMILPLYDNYIYILTRKDSKINSIQNLLGKRVNIELYQNRFSVTAKSIKNKHNLRWRETHYPHALALKKLLKKELDAIIVIDAKRSKKILDINKKDRELLKFISPQMDEEYRYAYITKEDYPWIDKEIKTNLVNVVLISYNYQKSQTIERFNYYVNNISTLIRLISKNMENLRQNGHTSWKSIKPYYYRKVKWPLHSVAQESIFKNMDRLDHFSNTFGMEFVTIPSGEFTMGSKSKELPADEKPQKQEYVERFSIMSTEVTQKQWLEVMGKNPSYFRSKQLDHCSLRNPVDSISYEDAQKFIDKLNSFELRDNYRLPTEKEWEYSAGDDAKDLNASAWYALNSRHITHRVAQKKPNKWGLYDMLGNVWEWCESDYTLNYAHDALQENFKVLRGGSFVNLPTNLRAAKRMKNIASIKRYNNGFRVVYNRNKRVVKNSRYRVKAGDSLSSVAQKFYNDNSKWDLIYYSNKDVIGKNISLIKPGQVLKIPKLNVASSFKEEVMVSKKEVSKRGIKLLSGTDFKPFLNPSLPYGGMANHIVKALFKEIDYDDYKIYWNKSFAKHFGLLERQKFDVGVAWYKPDCSKTNMSKETQKRCEFTFSKPIFEVITTLYKDKSKEHNSSNVKDLHGKKLCRTRGVYTFDLEARGLIHNQTITLVRPETKKECFEMLMSGEVDFVAIDKFSGKAIIKEMDIAKKVESMETISTLLGLHLIVHSKHPRAQEIIEKLNSGIDKLQKRRKLIDIQRDHLSNFFK